MNHLIINNLMAIIHLFNYKLNPSQSQNKFKFKNPALNKHFGIFIKELINKHFDMMLIFWILTD